MHSQSQVFRVAWHGAWPQFILELLLQEKQESVPGAWDLHGPDVEATKETEQQVGPSLSDSPVAGGLAGGVCVVGSREAESPGQPHTLGFSQG